MPRGDYWASLSPVEKAELFSRSLGSEESKKKSAEETRRYFRNRDQKKVPTASLVVDEVTGEETVSLSAEGLKSMGCSVRASRKLCSRWGNMTREQYDDRCRKQSESMILAHRDPSVARRISESERDTLSKLSDEEKESRLRKSFHSNEARSKVSSLPLRRLHMSEGAKRYWENLSIEKKNLHGRKSALASNRRPTAPERALGEFLEREYPGEWVYTGDGKARPGVAGKQPDFQHSYKRALMEVYGMNPWHICDDPQDRIAFFAKLDYKCLVLWDFEVYDPPVLSERVEYFARTLEAG